MHGEATSEKVALTRLLDGEVTAVIGTHTHVQTNDARVEPATGYGRRHRNEEAEVDKEGDP